MMQRDGFSEEVAEEFATSRDLALVTQRLMDHMDKRFAEHEVVDSDRGRVRDRRR